MRLLLVTDEEQGVDEFILELQECGVSCESMELKHDLITVDGGAELSEAFVKQLQQRMGGEEDVDALLLCEQQCYHGLDLPLLRRLCFLPILVLEKHPTAYDEILCLQNGSDDYLNRQISHMVLYERCARLVKLYNGKIDRGRECMGLTELEELLDYAYRGRPLQLKPAEYDILHRMLSQRDFFIEKEKLLLLHWGRVDEKSSRALDTLVKRLRRQLQRTPVRIKTIYGKGYRLFWDESHI